ncbi:MAG: hypothetical protein QOJ96_3540 [Alphaproteobacteria bacterium]|jgi:hypothetical protein|nr:hypothetical protein [Alphaproteobacteria bacterium]
MKLPDIPVANFTISENAKHGIDNLRQAFNARSSDPAMVPTVGWAKYMPNTGDPYEQVAVTFYGRSQYDEIAAAIQIVSGIEVVFLPQSRDYEKFDGKVLDFAADTGFFLRD